MAGIGKASRRPGRRPAWRGEDRAEDVPGIHAGSSVKPSIMATIGKTAGKHGKASGVAIVEHRHRRPAPERRSWRPSRQPLRPAPRRIPHKRRCIRGGGVAWVEGPETWKTARRVGNTVGNTRPGDALPRQDRSRKAEPPAMVHCRDRTPEEGVKAVSALLGAFVAVSRASTPAPTRRHALKTALLLGN